VHFPFALLTFCGPILGIRPFLLEIQLFFNNGQWRERPIQYEEISEWALMWYEKSRREYKTVHLGRYTSLRVAQLLDILEEVKPIGKNHWETLTMHYSMSSLLFLISVYADWLGSFRAAPVK
jgi:hypothetical protein